MRNITLEILKAIGVLLVLLPVVDLVDQHRIVGEVPGNRQELHPTHTVPQGGGGGGGVTLYTNEPPNLLLLDNNRTRIREEKTEATRRTLSGNWDSLSPTRSDILTSSVSTSREHLHHRHSSTLEMFSLSLSSSSASVPAEDNKYYISPSSSSSTYIKSSSRTITEHHAHVVAPMTTSTTTASGGGGGAGVKRDANNKGSNHLASFAVEPPLPLASSTRVTGPYFETNKTTIHLSAKAGQTVILDCAVILLQGRTVSWLKRRKDSLQLLTVGNTTYNGDSQRLGLRFRYPNNWRLGIDSVNKGDEGEYQCQLSTHPPRVLIYHLKVIAPSVVILDENGHSVTERHYKVDSSLHLTCRANHVDKFADKVVWLKGGRTLPGGDSRIKVKLTKNSGNGGEVSAFLSVLSVRRTDSGNYSCSLGSSQATSTITVHVLNGELPAAVQHESRSSRVGTPLKTTTLAAIAVLMMRMSTLFISSPQFMSSSSFPPTILIIVPFAIFTLLCCC